MQRTSVVSRPAWVNAISGSGANRKSPVEIFATAASVVTHSPYAEVSGLRAGKFGRWTDGVAAMREDCIAFAAYWRFHNERVLRERELETDPGPLWVVLGDSTAQGLGAPGPEGGYVGQTLQTLRRGTGRPWRVLNLSVSGALIRDVLAGQIPQLSPTADLRHRRQRHPLQRAREAVQRHARCSPRSRTAPCCSTCRCSPGSGESSAG